MKKRILIVSILLLLFGISAVNAASVVAATNPSDAAALVYVSGYDMNPAVFYPGETGTVTVHVTNSANASVSISQPALIDPSIDVVNQGAFTTATSIGPGATTDYNFIIRVQATDGTYFPLFTVSPNAYGSSAIHTQIKLKVDSTDVRASISQRPENFTISTQDTVNVSVVNPRLDNITDVLIVPTGSGAEVQPSEEYIGTIPAGGSSDVQFKITPHEATTLNFTVSFRNGDNVHTVSTAMPVNIGADKTAVVPVLNNIALTGSNGDFTLTGDVSNAGVTDATGMVLTIDGSAHPVEPYANYAIGSLQSNDFSSFTLTFTATDLSSVPVIIQWKDSNGNTFTSTQNLDLRTLAGSLNGGTRSGGFGSSASGSTGGASSAAGGFGGPGGGAARGGGGLFSFGGGSRGGGLSAFYPLIAGAIILILAAVIWVKRKPILARLKKKQ